MRRAKQKRLQAIYRAVQQDPGIRAGRVARMLNIPRSSVTRVLPLLEERGLLLSEDAHGRLRVFRRSK
jgi:Mn-dependent DtxR family transcriptional regulator